MKKILVISLLFCLLFTSVQGGVPALCKTTHVESVYVTDSIPLNLSKSVEIISPSSIDEINEVGNLWVDDFLIEDTNIRSKVKKMHEKGGRIIIRSSDLKLADIYEIFDKEQAKRIRDIEKEIAMKETENFQLGEEIPVGYVIINENGYKHVITLFAECKNDEFVTFEYASKYDYIDLIFSKDGEDTSNSDFNIKSGFGSDWGTAQTNTKTWGNIIVSESINLRENSSNPSFYGEYLYYVAYKIDVDPRYSDVGIGDIYIKTSGSYLDNPNLIDYGPLPGTSALGGGISFQLSYGIGSITYSTGTRTRVRKEDGGFNTRFIKHRYTPIDLVGFPSLQFDFMRAEGHALLTTTSPFLFGYGHYKIHGVVDHGPPYDYEDWSYERNGEIVIYVPSSSY